MVPRPKRPDLDSKPRKILGLPRTAKALRKEIEPVLKRVWEQGCRQGLNPRECLLMTWHDMLEAREKRMGPVTGVLPWLKKQPHSNEQFQRKKSPSPINIKNNNNNLCDTIASFEAPVMSSTLMQICKPILDSRERFLLGSLVNIGNSCYMNASLYCLRFIPAFTHNLHHFCDNMLLIFDENETNDRLLSENPCDKEIASVEFISGENEWPEFYINRMDELRQIIKQLHLIFAKLTSREKNEINHPLELELEQMQKFAENVNPEFKPGNQQDSHEFLMCILNSIRDCSREYLDLMEAYPAMFASINGDAASLLNFNYFHENFMGTRVTTMCCLQCESVRTRREDFVDMTIPLTGRLTENFIQGFSLKTQKLGKSEKVHCDACYMQSELKQTYSYERMPRVLIVHLGRFDNQLNKICTPTPISFGMNCFCIECMERIRCGGLSAHHYRLVSVIIHVGNTPTSGHYIAYVRAPEKSQQPQFECQTCCDINIKSDKLQRHDGPTHHQQWYICNDRVITPIFEKNLKEKIEQEAADRTPYVLFYVKYDNHTEQ